MLSFQFQVSIQFDIVAFTLNYITLESMTDACFKMCFYNEAKNL